ncbi:MAG TPA: leucyl aminopeptidase family protein, partial [Gammaproteobacteria bacterium]|nr:leucyl aminopeptidase family protein [Gammaproteobacteria bacterium]
ALVGKGICYDTGGANLKSDKSMFGMHGDMQGSAVALGTLLALTRLKAPFQIDAWLALARNQIGPKAYTQNEVVKAGNGVNIEVTHTDAEGRMVLADTLALATRPKPAITVDYATLTGACVTALGSRYSGAFTRDPDLAKAVIAAGARSGERVWPFPMDGDYDEDLESDIADVKQCVLESGRADHILASRFLSRFVQEGAPWIHVDLSASEHKGGLAHIPTEVTGFGVRFTLSLLLDQGLAPA